MTDIARNGRIGGRRKLKRDWQIGDSAYLKEAVKGYRYVEIVGFDGVRLVVQTTSGWECPPSGDILTLFL